MVVKDPSGLQGQNLGEKQDNGGGSGFGAGGGTVGKGGYWSPRSLIQGVRRLWRNLFGSKPSAPAPSTTTTAVKPGTSSSPKKGTEKGAKGDYRPTDAEGNPTPIPKDKDGNLVPDSPNPHTQIGTRTKSRQEGPYKQAIEFGKDGKPVNRIDFSDHTKPKIHPNPHQHPAIPSNAGTPASSIGGTARWGKAEPLTNGPD